MQSASEAVAVELDGEKRAAYVAVVAAAVDADAAVAVEYSRGPADVPIESATLGFHSDCCCCSSFDGSDYCSYSCSRS